MLYINMNDRFVFSTNTIHILNCRSRYVFNKTVYAMQPRWFPRDVIKNISAEEGI